jgi:hypothetical protein
LAFRPRATVTTFATIAAPATPTTAAATLTVTLAIAVLTFGARTALVMAVSALTRLALAVRAGGFFLSAEETLQPAKETTRLLFLARRSLGGRLRAVLAAAVVTVFATGTVLERAAFAALATFATLATLEALPAFATLTTVTAFAAFAVFPAFARLKRWTIIAARGRSGCFPAYGRPTGWFGREDVELRLVVAGRGRRGAADRCGGGSGGRSRNSGGSGLRGRLVDDGRGRGGFTGERVFILALGLDHLEGGRLVADRGGRSGRHG